MDGTDREGCGPGCRRRTDAALNEFGTVCVIVGTVGVEGGDAEVFMVGVGSGSQTVTSWASVLSLHAGSSEDGGDSEEGGDQELGVEEHRENERRGVGCAENEG